MASDGTLKVWGEVGMPGKNVDYLEISHRENFAIWDFFTILKDISLCEMHTN